MKISETNKYEQKKLNGISFVEELFRSGLEAKYSNQDQNYKGIKGVDKMLGTGYSK